MASRRTSVSVGEERDTSFVRELLNVVREVNEWRHERDAFVAMNELDGASGLRAPRSTPTDMRHPPSAREGSGRSRPGPSAEADHRRGIS